MSRFIRRKKFCRFTADGVKEIDYKDLGTLKGYISETGKIVPSTCVTVADAVVANRMNNPQSASPRRPSFIRRRW